MNTKYTVCNYYSLFWFDFRIQSHSNVKFATICCNSKTSFGTLQRNTLGMMYSIIYQLFLMIIRWRHCSKVHWIKQLPQLFNNLLDWESNLIRLFILKQIVREWFFRLNGVHHTDHFFPSCPIRTSTRNSIDSHEYEPIIVSTRSKIILVKFFLCLFGRWTDVIYVT